MNDSSNVREAEKNLMILKHLDFSAVDAFKKVVNPKYTKNDLSECMDKTFIAMMLYNGNRKGLSRFTADYIKIAIDSARQYHSYWYKIIGCIAKTKVDYTIFKKTVLSITTKQLTTEESLGYLLDDENKKYLIQLYGETSNETLNRFLRENRQKFGE